MKIKRLGKVLGGNPALSISAGKALGRSISGGITLRSKLLQTTAAVAGGIFFSGCELDAAGTDSAAQEKAATNAPITPAVTKAVVISTNAPAGTNEVAVLAISTNAPGGTNIVANQEVTILNEIPPAEPDSLNLTWPTAQVVKLAQSGLSDSVLIAYVQKSTDAFNLDAEDILYLNDIGVSEGVIAAMLNHDGADPALATAAKKEPQIDGQAPPAEARPPVQLSNLGAAPAPQPQGYEVTTNYVPNAPNDAIAGNVPIQVEAEPQQQVVVQQQPIIVQQQPQVVVVGPAVQYPTFYSSLSPYGSWLYVADYGWAWQPTVAVVNAGWRPYLHHGRWVDSNQGWYWHSDYSWGWAPFHYGRWHNPPGRGWVWMPDHTWGPSWVTWRTSGGYSGWAPLPPHTPYVHGSGFAYHDRPVSASFSFGLGYQHYNFVPTRHFADRRLQNYALPAQQSVNIYKDSTVVNNYISGANNTIVNSGISRDQVRSVSRTEIQKVNVRETPAQSRMVQPDRIRRDGNDLVVYRPTSVERNSSSSGTSSGIASRLTQEPSRNGNASTPGNATGVASRNHPRFQTATDARSSASRTEPARGELPANSRAVSPRGAANSASQSGIAATSPMTRGGARPSSSGESFKVAPFNNGTAPAISSRAGQELQRSAPGPIPADRQSVQPRRNAVPVVQGQTTSRSSGVADARAVAPVRSNPNPAAPQNVPGASTRSEPSLRVVPSHPRFNGSAGAGGGLVSTSPSGRPEAVLSNPGQVITSRSSGPSRPETMNRQNVAPSTPAQVHPRLQQWQNSQSVPNRAGGSAAPNYSSPAAARSAPQPVPSISSRSPEPARSQNFATPSQAPSSGVSRMEAWQQQQGVSRPSQPAVNSRSYEPARSPTFSSPAPSYNRPQPSYSAPSARQSAPDYSNHPRIQQPRSVPSSPSPGPAFQSPPAQRSAPSVAPTQSPPRASGNSGPSPATHPRFSGGGRGEERGR